MLRIISSIIISYLIGSIPTAYIFVKILKGADIRKFGSGNVGATNAFRLLGWGPAITILLIDILKCFVVVVFLADYLILYIKDIPAEIIRVLLGVICILGHNWTIFLNFKGGKGVASSLGFLLGLSFKVSGFGVILFLMLLTWLLVFLIFRIVSVASVIAAFSLPAYMVIFKQSLFLTLSASALSLFIIIRHRDNIKRFLKGAEPRLKLKK